MPANSRNVGAHREARQPDRSPGQPVRSLLSGWGSHRCPPARPRRPPTPGRVDRIGNSPVRSGPGRPDGAARWHDARRRDRRGPGSVARSRARRAFRHQHRVACQTSRPGATPSRPPPPQSAVLPYPSRLGSRKDRSLVRARCSSRSEGGGRLRQPDVHRSGSRLGDESRQFVLVVRTSNPRGASG